MMHSCYGIKFLVSIQLMVTLIMTPLVAQDKDVLIVLVALATPFGDNLASLAFHHHFFLLFFFVVFGGGLIMFTGDLALTGQFVPARHITAEFVHRTLK